MQRPYELETVIEKLREKIHDRNNHRVGMGGECDSEKGRIGSEKERTRDARV